MNSAPTSSPPSSNGGKTIFELVIATMPAVILYFVGWAYLNFYLRTFGIGVSELDLDIQTIFIYSFPPVQMLVYSHWMWTLVFLVALAVTTWVVHWISSATVALVYVLCAIILILVFALLPVIRSTATEAAGRKWVSEGVRIEVLIKEPEPKSNWYESYKRCSARRALDLIFSDKDSYYMLCISTVDKATALVFEVRRDAGLMSVRFATQGN